VVLHLRAQGLEEGEEHPPTLSCGAWSTLPLNLPSIAMAIDFIPEYTEQSGAASIPSKTLPVAL